MCAPYFSTDRGETSKNLNQCFSLLHQNVQSIGNSVNRLEVLLDSIGECNVLCLCEHWKNKVQLSSYKISGYSLISCYCRPDSNRGGVAVLVADNICSNASQREDINLLALPFVFECSAIEMCFNNVNLIVICLYRTPNSDLALFFERLEDVLNLVCNINRIIIIAGDFNINLN